jgi:predicted MFS family arabinose efflux permease
LTLAGTSLVAVSFGLARYGYGLFVPQFSHDLHLSTTQVGTYSSLSYVGYGLGLAGCSPLVRCRGARKALLLSATLVTAGIFSIAIAPDAVVFAIGVGLSGVGVGLCWPPFSDLAAHHIGPARRPRVVSTISTGTSFGLILAVPLAILASGAWRPVWIAFGIVALLTLGMNAIILPRGRHASARRSGPDGDAVSNRGFAALGCYSMVYGAIGATFFTFAVDLAHADDHGDAASAMLWAVVGIAGLSAIHTGEGIRRLGLRKVIAVLLFGMAAGLLAIAVAHSSLIVLYGGTAIFGTFYMAGAAVIPPWAARINPAAPTRPHIAATGASAVGSIVGAAAGGALAAATSTATMFAATAGVVFCIALALTPHTPHD